MICLGSVKRLFALQRSYNSWQGLKIATQQIWLHSSLRSPRLVNELRTISASIEQPESVFNILHTQQSEIIVEFPQKNSSCPLKKSLMSRSVEAQANWKEPWINKRPTSDGRCFDWQRTLFDDSALMDSIWLSVTKTE